MDRQAIVHGVEKSRTWLTIWATPTDSGILSPWICSQGRPNQTFHNLRTLIQAPSGVAAGLSPTLSPLRPYFWRSPLPAQSLLDTGLCPAKGPGLHQCERHLSCWQTLSAQTLGDLEGMLALETESQVCWAQGSRGPSWPPGFFWTCWAAPPLPFSFPRFTAFSLPRLPPLSQGS